VKNYIIISTLIPRARTIFLDRIKFWFFVFKGKRERTNVLEEGKVGVDHLKKEKNNLGYKFYNKQGREAKEEGEGREGGIEEEREGEVVFHVREDGTSWVYKNLVLAQSGASGYVVYIKGLQEGWEEEDMITCYIPNQLAMFEFLNYLLQGRRPLFSSLADFHPLC